MNPSTVAARELVDALARQGVCDVVLCPGSRSAPLAYALHAAESAGVVRLHVRYDERSAAFCAMGFGKADGVPAAVVTTSGTAVANLHPAVLEAHHAEVPLVVVTADRPHQLRGTWANQTSDLQAGLFANAVRWSVDLPARLSSGATGDWAGAVASAVAASRGLGGGLPGPVHLDVAFDDPLPPDDVWSPTVLPVAPSLEPPTTESGTPELVHLGPGPRTVVVAGDGAGAAARQVAEAGGWPLLAEPSSGSRSGPNAIGPYRLLLELERLGGRVERVLAFGRPTLSRPVTRLLSRPDVELVVIGPTGRAGPAREHRRLVDAPVVDGDAADGEWLQSWRRAGALAAEAIARLLEEEAAHGLCGPLLAQEVAAASGEGDVLVVAASNPVRDLDLAAAPFREAGPRVLANRGLSGIDGTTSTAVGVAARTGAPTRLLIGDLAFLHDVNGLAVPAAERAGVRLQVVVLNDDGGGIFGLLEHGEPARAASFERVFGTPHGTRLDDVCAGFAVPYRRVEKLGELRDALCAVPVGLSVVEVPADRARLRDVHARLRNAVHRAVAEHGA